jgi:hypothetical protein
VAKTYINKAQSNFKDYELENRIQAQIRSLQRKIKHLSGESKSKIDPAVGKAKEADAKKQQEINNFYLA